MDKLLAMTVFRTVVESGSFAKASETLGLSTTTTSRQVGELEKSLGISLLHRSTRKIALTDSGHVYFERCCAHLDDIAATEHAVGGQRMHPVGTLRLSVPGSFGVGFLAPRLEGFLGLYPELKLDIQFSERVVDLAAEGIDVAVRIARQAPAALAARPLATVRPVVCASPAYLAGHGVPQRPEDLTGHNCLSHSGKADCGEWRFDRDGESHVVRIQGSLRANSCEMMRMAALGGHGIIYEPAFVVAQDLREGRLVRLLPDYQTEWRTAFAIFRGTGRHTAKIRVFVDYLARIFEDDPAARDL